jgi:hypothetical protein
MKSSAKTGIPILPFFCAVFFLPFTSWSQKRQFQFEQFPAAIYKGPLHIPDSLHKDAAGDWQDENDKWFPAVEVGFAGEYYLPILSCGTGCRYHELFDLRTGAEIPGISMFDTPEQPPSPRTTTPI